jgi:hypothetical protein
VVHCEVAVLLVRRVRHLYVFSKSARNRLDMRQVIVSLAA